MNELIGKLKTDFADLDKRFNKKNRDVGLLAIERTKSIQRITNSASDKANRCIEIASGSPLTEKEINATKKSEINTECPSIQTLIMYHTKDRTYRLAWIIAVPLMMCLLLSGCGSVKQLEIFKQEVPRPQLNLEKLNSITDGKNTLAYYYK